LGLQLGKVLENIRILILLPIYIYQFKSKMMLTDILKSLFSRDLLKLRSEIEMYTSEDNIWKIEQGISNSAGNLCLHLIGNLNAYVGNVIGGSGYVRNRELEFSLKGVAKQDLLSRIDDTIHVVEAVLDGVDEAALAVDFPVLVFDRKTSTGYMLVHLTTHLAYHLGQINYHRRLIDG
jgi:hypothetical protein